MLQRDLLDVFGFEIPSVHGGYSFVNNIENREIVFYFEQCVGGVSFSIECSDEIFSNIVFNEDKDLDSEFDIDVLLISKLSDRVIVSEDGKKIELLFFVNGIAQELLLQRQEKIKEYNSNRILKNI